MVWEGVSMFAAGIIFAEIVHAVRNERRATRIEVETVASELRGDPDLLVARRGEDPKMDDMEFVAEGFRRYGSGFIGAIAGLPSAREKGKGWSARGGGDG
jgi:hypothetical protein